MDDEMKRLEDCVLYFKGRSVYKQLFQKVREKYISLGHFGGTVHLYGLQQDECQQLSGFFRKDFERKQDITISAAAMEKALESSKFAGLRWEDILQSYFNEEFIGKKQQKQNEKLEREQFFKNILETNPVNEGHVWMEDVLVSQGEGYQLLMKHYHEKPEHLRMQLDLFLKAVPCLPFLTKEGRGRYKLLAVFAAETTGNPHFFDSGTLGEKLLIFFLKSRISGYEGRTLASAEKKANILYEAGLLKDDLSNNTLVYGISGMDREGRFHEGIEGFWKRKEPILLTLMTLSGLKQVYTHEKNYVYVVENPAVFSKLIKAWPNETILCGNGQIRLATWVLLDLFDPKTIFFYAGDFDPEGLIIAQRLKERYGDRIHLWKYSSELYEKYQSEVEISEKSLKKLDKIYIEEFQKLKEVMLQKKKATYQETMLEEYLVEKRLE